MTRNPIENLNNDSPGDVATRSTLSESVNSSMTLEEIKTILLKKIAPERACIRDEDGYIACGPIVGLPRPENPGSGIFTLPAEPMKPPIKELPPKYEIPKWPAEPLDPKPKWPAQPPETPDEKLPSKYDRGQLRLLHEQNPERFYK